MVPWSSTRTCLYSSYAHVYVHVYVLQYRYRYGHIAILSISIPVAAMAMSIICNTMEYYMAYLEPSDLEYMCTYMCTCTLYAVYTRVPVLQYQYYTYAYTCTGTPFAPADITVPLKDGLVFTFDCLVIVPSFVTGEMSCAAEPRRKDKIAHGPFAKDFCCCWSDKCPSNMNVPTIWIHKISEHNRSHWTNSTLNLSFPLSVER